MSNHRERPRELHSCCLRIPEEYGCVGLNSRDVLLVFEQAGWALLGPPAHLDSGPDDVRRISARESFAELGTDRADHRNPPEFGRPFE